MEFDARSHVEPLLDGFGHLDRYKAVRDGSPFEGITLRLFDPTTAEWSIHWADTARANPPAADDREVHWRGRGVLWRRNGGREKGPLPVPLDATHDELTSMGTGVFGRWREDVENELDHDVQATMMARRLLRTLGGSAAEESNSAAVARVDDGSWPRVQWA